MELCHFGRMKRSKKTQSLVFQKEHLFSGFRNFQTHRSECCGGGCTNIAFTARCTSETRELLEFLQQSSWGFQVLAGDKQQITAERAQERPQVGKYCRSQGGKSWIREGMALQQNKGHLVFSGRAEFVPWLREVPSVPSDHSVLHPLKDLHHFSCWDAAFPHDGDATFPEGQRTHQDNPQRGTERSFEEHPSPAKPLKIKLFGRTRNGSESETNEH